MTTTARANPYSPATTPLPPIVVTGRLDRLRAAFDEHEIDALIVTTLPNVRYLAGFTGSAAVLVVTRDLSVLTTDGRYRTQSAEQLERAGAPEVEISIGSGTQQRDAARAALEGAKGARIGLEAGNITWSGQRGWADVLSGDKLVPTANAVEALRERKDAAELARMERAAAIADAALFEVLPLMSQGVTEEHFALELDTAMRRGGAEGTAFETIVAAG
ncbi:MAG TPA: aminopeptidase P family N-terminal domain-containing protein, partial [Acidimicrobiales bacterium]